MSVSYGYAGKRVVVTGAASGMGHAATAMLVADGAEVFALDLRQVTVPIARSFQVDLRDRAAIDATVADIDGRIDGLFNCAGLPGNFDPLDVVTVNYLAVRHLTEALLPRISAGGAVVHVSSKAAIHWQSLLDELVELVSIEDIETAEKWLAASPRTAEQPYQYSKAAVVVYTKLRAGELCSRQVRMNCIMPGAVDTPMMRDHFIPHVGLETMEKGNAHVGRMGTPEEMAHALLFLNSDGASYISGEALVIDHGHLAGYQTGRLEAPPVFFYEPVVTVSKR